MKGYQLDEQCQTEEDVAAVLWVQRPKNVWEKCLDMRD